MSDPTTTDLSSHVKQTSVTVAWAEGRAHLTTEALDQDGAIVARMVITLTASEAAPLGYALLGVTPAPTTPAA